MAIKQTTAVRNAQLDALNTQTGASARLRIYNGTRPANANTAITSQTMLVELTCNATAFAAAAISAAAAARVPTIQAPAAAGAPATSILPSSATPSCWPASAPPPETPPTRRAAGPAAPSAAV